MVSTPPPATVAPPAPAPAHSRVRARAFSTLPLERGVELATALFIILGIALAATGVGIQFDEGVFQIGAVQMLAGARGLGNNADWVTVLGANIKIMTFPYAGSVHELLLLLPFRVFGTDPMISRSLSVALGAIGVAGIGHLMRRAFGPGAGCAAALVLALNPTLLDQCTFDNSLVADWMAFLGLACFALASAYFRPTALRLAAVGFPLGLLTWARLNALWMLAAVTTAMTLVLLRPAGRWIRLHPRQATTRSGALLAGYLLGVLPILTYELKSGWATLDMNYVAHQPVTRALLQERLVQFSGGVIGGAPRAAGSAAPVIPALQRSVTEVAVVLVLLAGATLTAGRPQERRWRRILVPQRWGISH